MFLTSKTAKGSCPPPLGVDTQRFSGMHEGCAGFSADSAVNGGDPSSSCCAGRLAGSSQVAACRVLCS